MGGVFAIYEVVMKESKAFQFIGNMALFENLLNDVNSLTDRDWEKNKERKMNGGAAASNTDTIPLMYDLTQRLNSGITHENYAIFEGHIDEIVRTTAKTLGEMVIKQAMLTRLKANTVIPRHRDKGPLTAKTHRIHVPVITSTKCIFKVGDEAKNLKTGEIWVIDNVNRYHSVENTGDTDRIHLIIDAI